MPAGEGISDALLVLEGEGYGEGWAVPAADEESAVMRGEFENLWPLQLVDLRDKEMVGTLFRLLRTLPQVCTAVPWFRARRRGWGCGGKMCVHGYDNVHSVKQVGLNTNFVSDTSLCSCFTGSFKYFLRGCSSLAVHRCWGSKSDLIFFAFL